jgi:hypothetical protein
LGEEEDGDGGADEEGGEDGGEGHDVGVLELWVLVGGFRSGCSQPSM